MRRKPARALLVVSGGTVLPVHVLASRREGSLNGEFAVWDLKRYVATTMNISNLH